MVAVAGRIMQNKILLIDSDVDMFLIVKDILEVYGYHVDHCAVHEQFDTIDFEQYSLLLVDWIFPQLGGMKIYEQVREKGYAEEVLMMSARTLDNDQRLKFEQQGIMFLAKPFSVTSLTFTVAKIFDR